MSNTKIVVLRMKEIIYTVVFAGLGILLLVVLFFMFWSGDEDKETTGMVSSEEKIYSAGIYTKEMSLGDSKVELQVTLDEDRVKAVTIVGLDETVSAMYPLMKPSVENISNQLAAGVDIDSVELSDESQYTEKMIINEIKEIVNENTAK